MLVTLIGEREIYKLVLPSVVRGNYWITRKTEDGENKLVNIEAIDGTWYIRSNSNVFVNTDNLLKMKVNVQNLNGSIPQKVKILDKVAIDEYSLYMLSIKDVNEKFILITSPVYERDYKCFEMTGNSFCVGSNPSCEVVYNNIIIADKQAVFTRQDDVWYVENYDSNVNIFINNKYVDGQCAINNGDVVYIMGLKIIIIGNYIYVNGMNGKVKLRYGCKE